MAKVFSLDKFVESSIRLGENTPYIKSCITSWALDCLGKTEEELRGVGLGVVDKWMVEKEEDKFEVSEGDLFYIDSDPYILAKTDVDTYCLISLDNGNRWEEPVSLDDLDIPRNMFEELFINNDDKEWYQVPQEDREIVKRGNLGSIVTTPLSNG